MSDSPSCSKIGLSAVGDHAPGPGAPVEGNDAAARQTRACCWAHLLRYSLAAAYATWPGAAETGGRRRKKDQERERIGIDRPKEMMKALDLGLVDQVELSIGLIDDLAVGEDARSVN